MPDKNYFIEKGNIERERGNFQKAMEYYKKAKKIGRSFESEIGIAHCLRMSGDFEGSLKIYDDISKKYKKKEIVADSLLGKALSLKGLSKTEEAIKFLKKAEEIYESLNDDLAIAHLFWAYSVVFRVAGDLKEALNYGEKALSMFNYYENEKGILYSSCALGGLNRILGNLKDSFQYYLKANELAKKLKDKFGTAYSYCGIGNYYRMRYKIKKAMEYFKEAEKIYNKINDIVSYSYTLWSMGILKTQENKMQEAMDYFKKAQNNFEKTKDQRGIIYCLLGIIQLKSILKQDYELEIEKCKNIFKKYNLKWEKLLFEIIISKLKGKKDNFNKKIISFGSLYDFKEFPVNIP